MTDVKDLANRELESNVRSYCRTFPTEFVSARGAVLVDAHGQQYIDFFCGAGSNSYGHNHPQMKAALIEYLQADGITNSLDMSTTAKERFLRKFHSIILEPRDYDYRIQLVGPTGTNAVEAALKLARKVTGRRGVLACSNGYHGLTAGALAVTSAGPVQHCAYQDWSQVTFIPYDGYYGPGVDTAQILEQMLMDPHSGVDLPAALILETVQGEGGVYVASARWLRRIADLCHTYGILLLVDDIQVGCGRTGQFFSFERAGIRPDLVILSKSISGFGLPMSIVLIRPDLDVWDPGEHAGTFRGNNLAFVTAVEALRLWEKPDFGPKIADRATVLSARLQDFAKRIDGSARGVGLIQGLEVVSADIAEKIATRAFELGLLIERCGPKRRVFKFLPPLIIDPEVLNEGLMRFDEALKGVK